MSARGRPKGGAAALSEGVLEPRLVHGFDVERRVGEDEVEAAGGLMQHFGEAQEDESEDGLGVFLGLQAGVGAEVDGASERSGRVEVSRRGHRMAGR